MRAVRFLFAPSLFLPIAVAVAQSPTPGLPFTEAFATTDLRDAALTTAFWSTTEGVLRHPPGRPQYGAFDPDLTSGTDITADSNATVAVAAGDINGDGRADLIAGNSGQPDRLYLNNGTASPFEGVTGQNITTDSFNTRSLAVGDVDGDGDLDLVVGYNAESPRLYLNNGSPTEPFEGVTGIILIPDTFDSNGLALEDMDGDGDLDVILGISNRKTLLLLNNGSSEPFLDVEPQPVSDDVNLATSVAVGDVNGDGVPDVVVGNFNQPNRLYLNNGTASPFDGVAGADISSNTDSTRAIAVGDVDGDGDLDVVSGNSAHVNRIYLNNGTQAPFEGVTGIDVSQTVFQTFGVSLGDVEGDGDLDLIVTVSDNRNRLFLNNGTPSPFEGAAALSLTTDSVFRRGGVLADFDSDGDLDYAVAVLNAPNRLYLNPSGPNPWNGVVGSDIISDGSRTQEVAIGDMDGDGDLDLVVGNGGFGDAPNRLYLNNGTSNPFDGVTGSDITAEDQGTRAIAAADVDGDGDLDVVAGNTGVNSRNRLYLNNGTSDPFGGVIGSDITSDEHTTRDVALGDMDGDGDLDFIAGNANTPPRFYRNNGSANPFAGAVGTDITTDIQGADDIALGDMDGDGDLDLVYTRFLDTTRLVLNNGTSDPFAGVIGSDVTADTPPTVDLELGDADGDGDLDIFLAVENQPPRIYLNNGTSDPFQGVSGKNISLDARDADSIALGDVDGDGDLDVGLGNSAESNRLYLNNGTLDPFEGVVGLDITADVNDNSTSVALADMDGDGALDFVVGVFNDPSRLFLNSGLPKPVAGWAAGEILSATKNTTALAIGDLDGDGDLDLVAGIEFQPNKFYLNNGTPRPFEGVEGTDITTDEDPTNSAALGDVDGDGDLDLVVGNGSGASGFNRKNRLYLNNGTSQPFEGVTGTDISSDEQLTSAVALGDIDGDGDLDMVAGNSPLFDTSGVNRLYLNNGTANPFDGVVGSDITSDASATSGVALGDMDGDGDLDLVTSNFNQKNRLYLNNGTANPFDGVTGSDITSDMGIHRAVVLGDIDRDGDLDVILANSGRNRLYLNNGTADPFNGVTGRDITTDAQNTAAAALGDIDDDGDIDLVVGNFLTTQGRANFLYLNNGTADPFAGASRIEITGDAHNTFAIACGDLNGDGSLDVVAGNRGPRDRVYTRRLFDASRGRGVSLTVDDENSNISEIVFEATESLPINTRIDYWISNNGGLQSFLLSPGEAFQFPTTGSDLRWRTELYSLSPIHSPRLDTLTMNHSRNLRVEPLSVDFLEHPIEAGPTSSVTLTLTNSGSLPLAFSGFGLFGANFSDFVITHTPPQGSLAAGAAATASVAFDPATVGPKSAVFQIGSDDPDDPVIEIALAGIGIESPTETATPTPTETPTDSETPTATETPTEDLTPTEEVTPTPTMTTEYDIQPDPTDGFVDARDLIEWLNRIDNDDLPASAPEDLLFDFSLHWKR